MKKHIYGDLKLSHGIGVVLLAFFIACSGCFSSTRYTATLHPSQVKPASHITSRYRVAKVLVKESWVAELARFCGQKGWLDEPNGGFMQFCPYVMKVKGVDALQALCLWELIKDFDTFEFEARHKLDTEMVYESINAALTRLYPTLFCNDASAIPLTIMISIDASYKVDIPSYYPRIAMFFWPLSASLETKYDLWVKKGLHQEDEKEIMKKFDEVLKAKHSAKQESTVVRSSEVWETVGFPIGAIPISGESQWSKKTGFVANNGSFRLYRSGDEILGSTDWMSLAYVPEVDSEVLAAAVVQELNKMK